MESLVIRESIYLKVMPLKLLLTVPLPVSIISTLEILSYTKYQNKVKNAH